MASQDHIKRLNEKVATVLAFDRAKLTKRDNWGSITFEKAAADFSRILDIANYLKVLPVEILTDQTADQIIQALEQCRTTFDQIAKFSLESSGNPSSTRDQFVGQVKAHADQLFMQASPWIPFLAYQKGDVNENIAQLNSAVGKATAMIDQAKLEAETKAKEIDLIIAKAREASVAAGAAVFTTDFKNQGVDLEKQAKGWLWITGILAVVTLTASVGFYFYINPANTQLEVFQRIAAKLAVLGVLITSTIWCGRVYKALMHQASVYRFKALGLQTFQAFSAGAAEAQTKDAVLLETTRSIFAQPQSGYIEDGGSNDTRIVEVLKSALPSNE